MVTSDTLTASGQHREKSDTLVVLRAIAARLDRASDTPLFNQVAQAVRWEVGMGRLVPGTRLPGAREAGEVMRLSFHTVRRAFAELARAGIVDSARRRGTVVRAASRRSPPRVAPAVVVECNLTQAGEIALELTALEMPACPWLLHWPEPAPGPLITTPFHVAEVRRRWPGRDVRLVGLQPHPQLGRVAAERMEALGLRGIVVLERDSGTAHGMASEVRRLVAGTGRPVRAAHDMDVETALRRWPDRLLMIAPRSMDALDWTLLAHPRTLEVRFVVSTDKGAAPRAAHRRSRT